MHRRRVLVAVVASIVFSMYCSENAIITGTGSTGTDKPDFSVKDLGQYIDIDVGQTVLVESENLQVEFSRVLYDSRCPDGAYCVWEGQAEIELWLSKPDCLPERAVPVTRPGTNPGTTPCLTAAALGYRVSLMALMPYPHAGTVINEDGYTATLGIEKLPDGDEGGRVQVTCASSHSLEVDDVTVHEADISADTLDLLVLHGGGCGNHGYKLFMKPDFMESHPVQVNLYVQHINHDDPCESMVSRGLQFDIRRVAELYRDMYGGYDDVKLNIYGCFQGVPSGMVSVVYSPE